MRSKILLSKGELRNFCQEFLEEYNIKTDIGNEKPSLVFEKGDLEFRAMRSRDIPKMFKEVSGDYGITGIDVVVDELLNGSNQNFEIIYSFKNTCPKSLVGNLCLLKKEEILNPKVVVSDYYENIAKYYFDLMVEKGEVENYELSVVKGGVEGYVAAGEADMGIDTVYTGETLNRTNELLIDKGEKTIKKTNIMEAYPVVIAKPGYSFDDFQCILKRFHPKMDS